MDIGGEKFWLNQPTELLCNWTIIPNKDTSFATRLNVLTRLLVVITLILFFLDYDEFYIVFIIGIIIILSLRAAYSQSENFSAHRSVSQCKGCSFDSTQPTINQKYEVSPQNQYTHLNTGLRSYANARYKVVPLYTPPVYSEVWRDEPRFCNEFSQQPESYSIISPASPGYEKDYNSHSPKCFFEDTMYRDNVPTAGCGKYMKQSVSPAIQSAFIRDSSLFRNSIEGEYIDFFGRQRQHACSSYKPGRKTF